jgi:hypothetical protein
LFADGTGVEATVVNLIDSDVELPLAATATRPVAATATPKSMQCLQSAAITPQPEASGKIKPCKLISL